eukprot:scaffold299931_cov19-Prasinocladus_malaysianus.AAC.1
MRSTINATDKYGIQERTGHQFVKQQWVKHHKTVGMYPDGYIQPTWKAQSTCRRVFRISGLRCMYAATSGPHYAYRMKSKCELSS